MSDQSVLLLCGDEDERSLLERLKIRRGEEIDPVPSQLLRKYIGYARKYVHPHLSAEAADVLQVGQTDGYEPCKSGHEARQILGQTDTSLVPYGQSGHEARQILGQTDTSLVPYGQSGHEARQILDIL